MCYYAKQIEPEHQNPYLEDDEYYNDIAVFGNRHFKDRIPDVVETVLDALEYGRLRYEKSELANYGFGCMTEALSSVLPPPKAKYAGWDVYKLRKFADEYMECHPSKEPEIICKVLKIVTGEEWNSKTIRGCSQYEWNNIIYPKKKYSRADIRNFETLYFNMGSEWIIHDEDSEPKTPDDISGYCVYCVGWDGEGVRKELADYIGCDTSDIVMYAHDGYTRTSKYKEV